MRILCVRTTNCCKQIYLTQLRFELQFEQEANFTIKLKFNFNKIMNSDPDTLKFTPEPGCGNTAR